MNRSLKIGMFGFGCVGQGLYDILKHTAHFNAEVKKICVKNRTKRRSLDTSFFTYEKYDLLNDPEINCIVELIDDPDEAFAIVKQALIHGKDVVSANKRMLAYHLRELYEIQRQYGSALLYEGSCCGSIPIIRNLEEFYNNEPIHAISGIFNGSTNYILTKIFSSGASYHEALSSAQELGFAESDPVLDVQAFDPKFKLAILTAHAFGSFVNPDEILNLGIENLAADDLLFAKNKKFKIKLLASAHVTTDDRLSLHVMPSFVPEQDFLYAIENEFNAVKVDTTYADLQYFSGKGAGGHPTGSAVLSDISALGYRYKYEYKKLEFSNLSLSNKRSIDVYVRFPDPNLISHFDFLKVTEEMKNENQLIVRGGISVAHLVFLRKVIVENKIFIVSLEQIRSETHETNFLEKFNEYMFSN